MPIRRGFLLLIFLAGCVSPEPSRSGVDWQTLKVAADPGPDRVLLDVALVQRPLGDPFLTTEIWSSTDEMILSPDLRELLELNGYRIGLLVGSPPEKLSQLLQSDRSCIERRGRSAPTGALLPQNLRECAQPVEGVVYRNKTQDAVTFDRPLFAFDLLPTLKQNSVSLKITPRIESGERAMTYKPVPEEAKWTLEVKRPTRLLDHLAAEIVLAPNQILIIGPRAERENSIGHHSFIDDQSDATLQRLLIIRHVRSTLPTSSADAGDIPYPAVSRSMAP